MNITATTSTQYTSQTSQTTRNERTAQVNTPSQTPKHVVKALDEKANKILDKLLEGMEPSKKTAFKFSLDAFMDVKQDANGLFVHDPNASTSESAVNKKIDKLIKDLTLPGQTDMLGQLDILEQLKELYLDDYSPLDIKA